jgi:hypothetical protein
LLSDCNESELQPEIEAGELETVPEGLPELRVEALSQRSPALAADAIPQHAALLISVPEVPERVTDDGFLTSTLLREERPGNLLIVAARSALRPR